MSKAGGPTRDGSDTVIEGEGRGGRFKTPHRLVVDRDGGKEAHSTV